MNDFAQFRSNERPAYFWLGSEAEAVCIEYTSQQQRARELVPLIDNSDIDE